MGQKAKHVMAENFVFLSNEDLLCCISVVCVLMCISGKVTKFHRNLPFNMESLGLSGLQSLLENHGQDGKRGRLWKFSGSYHAMSLWINWVWFCFVSGRVFYCFFNIKKKTSTTKQNKTERKHPSERFLYCPRTVRNNRLSSLRGGWTRWLLKASSNPNCSMREDKMIWRCLRYRKKMRLRSVKYFVMTGKNIPWVGRLEGAFSPSLMKAFWIKMILLLLLLLL